MSTPVFYRRRAERFAQLLDEPAGGRQPAGHDDKELDELVAVGRRISTLQPAPDIDTGFRTELRAMLMATAAREGIGVTATATTKAPKPARRPLRVVRSGRRARTRGVVIIGVAVGAITVSGISAASDNSLPGDALYGLKRSTEKAQLAWASSDTERGERHLEFARIRLAEAHALQGDGIKTEAVLDDMDAEIRQAVGLLGASAVQRRENPPLDALASFVREQREQLTALLDRTRDADRDRVTASLDLLDSVAQRVEALRTALACGASPATQTDALGLLPGRCATGG
ncbi:MAG TPA: DUF5667 domain-containing protein [Micromonosporaceae bacterium]|nr:DUF5667 domain-containing protein [Micromonosporaceae bacterium]